jgi:hypothetical protein
MAAKPLDIRIIKRGTREPNYLANYFDFISFFLIKLQAFFSFSFLYLAPAGAGKGALEPSVAGMAVCSFKRI